MPPAPTPDPGYVFTFYDKIYLGFLNYVMTMEALLYAILPKALLLSGLVMSVRLIIRFLRMFGRA